jgi:hypothetical protein
MHKVRTNRRRSAHSLVAGLICIGINPNSALANDETPAEHVNRTDLSGPSECQASDTDWFVAELADVNVTETSGGDIATFHALNLQQESIGHIQIAATPDNITIHAQFADGTLTLVVDPAADPEDEAPRMIIEGLSSKVIQDRVHAASHVLAQGGGGQEGWMLCGLTIAATAAACAGFETGVGALACVAGAGVAACECRPLVSDKFQENEC